MWMHYLDPHLPYHAHKKYPVDIKPSNMAEYVAELNVSLQIRAKFFGMDKNDQDFFKGQV